MNLTYFYIGMAVILLISFKLHDRQKRKNKVICVVESNCTGCRRCIKRCNRHVLEAVKSETGIHAVVEKPDKCTACSDCLSKCKFNALKLVERGK